MKQVRAFAEVQPGKHRSVAEKRGLAIQTGASYPLTTGVDLCLDLTFLETFREKYFPKLFHHRFLEGVFFGCSLPRIANVRND